MRSRLKFFIFAVLFVGVIHVFSQGYGSLPGLGRLLSLSEGVYKNAKEDTFEDLRLAFPHLNDRVSVIFDKNGVPHIFAKNRKDLFFTQGFLAAKYRLWQMDITTRAGGGEISEVFGSVTKEADQFFIQLGLRKAAKESYEIARKDPEMMVAVSNYVAGVNAFIESLEYKDWPIEYKITQFRPKPFDEIRVFQILTLMSFHLAARSYDLPLTEIVNHLGWKRAVDLFPDFYASEMGVQGYDSLFHDPLGRTSNRATQTYTPFQSAIKDFPKFLRMVHTDGSNSWLIPKERSQSGNNILANDTHLGLRAPAVWMENRLFIEGDLNVYGASFPGAPTVVLGFNSELAWGTTNGTVDVVDWFEVEFQSEDSREYLLDGKWVQAHLEQDELRIKGRPSETIETLWTEFGPVVHREGKLGLAVRWTAQEPSNEVKSFFSLNWAKSVEEAKEILKDYQTPIQNFSLADRNSVALVTAGSFPKKPYGFGRVIENGRRSEKNWSDFIHSPSEFTTIANGNTLALSANQRPVGSTFPYYLGWDFEEPFRGQRIETQLKGKEEFAPKDMMAMQTDSFNQFAYQFFQLFDRKKLLDSLDKASAESLLEGFFNWDLKDESHLEFSTIFYNWIETIEDELWKKEFGFQEKKFYPKKSRTLIELKKRSLHNSSDFEALLVDTLTQALSKDNGLVWGEKQPSLFRHVTGFPGLGGPKISPSGSRYSLSANRGGHGGAWRLVVEMSDPVKAWSRIPGSIEGNPLNPNFNSNFKEWGEGSYQEVQFLSQDELLREAKGQIALVPE